MQIRRFPWVMLGVAVFFSRRTLRASLGALRAHAYPLEWPGPARLCLPGGDPSLRRDVRLEYRYVPFFSLLQGINEERRRKRRQPLRSRGEAVLTLLDAHEYRALERALGEEAAALVDRLAREAGLENLILDIDGLGRSRARIEDPTAGRVSAETYYLIVKSPELLAFRRALAREAKLPRTQFRADAYHPHITLGFSHRDLHEEDGVRKDLSTRVAGVDVR